ncbi:MAG: PDZ domain-containing protein, partial [Anaerolineae bacterium]
MTFIEFADGPGLSQTSGRLRPSNKGGLISSVQEGSPAEKAGLLPGDELLSVNGHRLRDIIDY